MRHTQLTRRGWAVVYVVGMVAGAIFGLLITQGDSPCDYAVTIVECE